MQTETSYHRNDRHGKVNLAGICLVTFLVLFAAFLLKVGHDEYNEPMRYWRVELRTPDDAVSKVWHIEEKRRPRITHYWSGAQILSCRPSILAPPTWRLEVSEEKEPEQ